MYCLIRVDEMTRYRRDLDCICLEVVFANTIDVQRGAELLPERCKTKNPGLWGPGLFRRV
jgi:hypothetical protein